MPRYFTLDQANKAVETIRPLVEEIQSIRQSILEKQPEAWPAVERAAGKQAVM